MKTVCHSLITAAALSLGTCVLPSTPVFAADHADAPTLAYDQASDIADVYFFVDPNDTDHAVLIGTTHGFIVPGEAANLATFDPVVRYRFEIYNKHVNQDRPPNPDPADTNAVKSQKNAAIKKYVNSIKPDKFIDVTFSPRTAEPGPAGAEALQVPIAQTAHLQFIGFPDIDKRTIFDVEVTNPNLQLSPSTNPLIVSPVGSTGIQFAAGETDDPFFFDIPAFAAFIQSVRAGQADGTVFSRGRDTFAGYNVLSIALKIPTAMLRSVASGRSVADAGKFVGVDFVTQRHTVQSPTKTGEIKGSGAFKTIDREGNPAVNVVLIPAVRKNEYNVATAKDDASLRFALPTPATRHSSSQPGILDVLNNLGVGGGPFDGLGVSSQGTLAAVAVLQGDLLKLDTTIPSGFPNGRTLSDDVVDTLLTIVVGSPVGDGVDANDRAPAMSFPYLGAAHQPLANTNDVDTTRN